MTATRPVPTASPVLRHDGEQQSNNNSSVYTTSTSASYSVGAVGLCFSVPALGGALFGWDIGATSFVIAQMMKQEDDTKSGEHDDYKNNHDQHYAAWTDIVAVTPSLAGFLVATASLGAFLGSLFIMLLLQQPSIHFHLSRRQELRVGALLYAMGTLLQVVAGSALQFWSGLGLLCFFLGRLVYGLAIGIVMHAAPTYLAEQMPSSIRGMVVSGKEAAIVLGILLGNIVGDWFYSADHYSKRWIYAYACSWFLSSSMFFLSYLIPRSCRWLLSQGRDQEALASLQFVYKSQEVALSELQTMQQALQDQEELLTSLAGDDDEMRDENGDDSSHSDAGRSPFVVSVLLSSWSFLWDPRYRAPLVAGVGLVVLQQITGQPSVLSYATPIFQQAGLSKDSTVLVAIFKLLTTLAAAWTVEAWGRKRLLYVGCSLMLMALLVLTGTIGQATRNVDGNYLATTTTINASGQQQHRLVSILILLSMFLYIGGYQFSFGPISWLMISEVFPLSVRGQAVAFAVQMNFLCNAVVQFGVPTLSSSVGLGTTFGVFACLTAYSIYFVRVRVPETKGLTLEQIEEQFREMGAIRSEQYQMNNEADTEALLENIDHQNAEEQTNDDELPD